MSSTIDTQLSRLRVDLGMTQAEVALRAETDEASIGKIESGKRQPGFRLIVRLAKAMKVTPVRYFELMYETWGKKNATKF